MSKQLTEFLSILETESIKKLDVVISTGKIGVSPLSFKQQKLLVTSGMNGIIGSMGFLKNLNNIILENSDVDDIKIYDRIPIILELRKNFSKKAIVKDDISANIDDLIKQYKKFDIKETETIQGEEFEIVLKIPTLKEENKYISICIEDLKKIDTDNFGKNISLILSYEIPKFIKCINFNGSTLEVDSLSIGDRNKIIDNLPAEITTQITDYIVKIREYDEMLLTVNGTLFEIDYAFFE